MRITSPTAAKHGANHRLDPFRIVETAENLAREVGERLPGSNLSGLAVVLVHIAHSTDEQVRQAQADLFCQGGIPAGNRRKHAALWDHHFPRACSMGVQYDH